MLPMKAMKNPFPLTRKPSDRQPQHLDPSHYPPQPRYPVEPTGYQNNVPRQTDLRPAFAPTYDSDYSQPSGSQSLYPQRGAFSSSSSTSSSSSSSLADPTSSMTDLSNGRGGATSAASSPRARMTLSATPPKVLVTHDPFFYERQVVPPISQVTGSSALSGDAAPSGQLFWPGSRIPLSKVIGPLVSAPTVLLPRDPAFRLMASTLDLTRITNRIIASGLCWRERTERKSHRNNLDDMARFLNTRYPGKYMIWNLAGDTAQGSYDTSPFYNQVVSFGMSKAYQLSLKTLFDICRSIHAWLSLDDANVAVVHCSNGVGRTGTAIACYLRYADIFEDASEAFNHFISRRTPNDESWVGVSQKRYVQYVNNVILLNGGLPNPYPLQLHRVILNTVPAFDSKGSCHPGLEIYQTGQLVFSSIDGLKRNAPNPQQISSRGETMVHVDAKHVVFRFPRSMGPLMLEKDIQMRVFHRPDPDGNPSQVVTMINFSFHAGFMPSGLIRVAAGDLELARRDVDEGKFDSNFSVDLVFTEPDLESANFRGYKPVSYHRFLDRSLPRCLARLISYHVTKADERFIRGLEEQGASKALACFALQKTNNNPSDAQEWIMSLVQSSSVSTLVSKGLYELGRDARAKMNRRRSSVRKPAARDFNPSRPTPSQQQFRGLEPSDGFSLSSSPPSGSQRFAPAPTLLPSTTPPQPPSNRLNESRALSPRLDPHRLSNGSSHDVRTTSPVHRSTSQQSNSSKISQQSQQSQPSKNPEELNASIRRLETLLEKSKSSRKRQEEGDSSSITSKDEARRPRSPSSSVSPNRSLGSERSRSPSQGRPPRVPAVSPLEELLTQLRSRRLAMGIANRDARDGTSSGGTLEAYGTAERTGFKYISPAVRAASRSASQSPPRSPPSNRVQHKPIVSPQAAPYRTVTPNYLSPRSPRRPYNQSFTEGRKIEVQVRPTIADGKMSGKSPEKAKLVEPPADSAKDFKDESLEIRADVEFPQKGRQLAISPAQSPQGSFNSSSPPSGLRQNAAPSSHNRSTSNGSLSEEKTLGSTASKQSVVPPAPPPPVNVPAPLSPDPSSRSTMGSRLQWDEIRDSKRSTAWSPDTVENVGEEVVEEVKKESGATNITLDVKRFEELFCIVPGTKSKTGGGLKMVQKGQFMTLLDLRRANNVAICLSRFTRRNMTNDDLTRQISELDDSELTADDFVSIQSLLPTPEEKSILEAHIANAMSAVISATKPPPPPLAPAEQFMIHCLRIPDLPQRLTALILRIQLPLEADEMTKKLRMMRIICYNLRTSDHLRSLLRIVLQLGNLSNNEYGAGNSSYRPWMGKEARALGFKVDGLARLKDVKSADGKWSLMTFLVDMVQQSKPEVLDFPAAFTDMRRARHIDLRELVGDLSAAEEDLAKVKAARYIYEAGEEARDSIFRERLDQFLSEAALMLESVRAELYQFSSDWADTARYFGEDLGDYITVNEIIDLNGELPPKSTSTSKKLPMHLFNALDLFFQGFEESVKQSRKRAEEELKRQKKATGGPTARYDDGRTNAALSHLQQQRQQQQPFPSRAQHPGYQPPARHAPGAGVRAALAALSARSNPTTAAAAAAAAGIAPPTVTREATSSEAVASAPSIVVVNQDGTAAPAYSEGAEQKFGSTTSRAIPGGGSDNLSAPDMARSSSTRELLQTREAEAREMMQRFSVMPSLPPEDLAALADAADAAAEAEEAAEQDEDDDLDDDRDDYDDDDDGSRFDDGLQSDVDGSRFSGSHAGGSSVTHESDSEDARRRTSRSRRSQCETCYLPKDECECDFF